MLVEIVMSMSKNKQKKYLYLRIYYRKGLGPKSIEKKVRIYRLKSLFKSNNNLKKDK